MHRYNSAIDKFIDIYGFAGWWASNTEAEQTANYYEIAYYCDYIRKKSTLRSDGLSVRCVMD